MPLLSSFPLSFPDGQFLPCFCYLSAREENPTDFGDPSCLCHSGIPFWRAPSLDPHGRAKLGKSKISAFLEEEIFAGVWGGEQGGISTGAAVPGCNCWRMEKRSEGSVGGRVGNLNDSQEGVLVRERKVSPLSGVYYVYQGLILFHRDSTKKMCWTSEDCLEWKKACGDNNNWMVCRELGEKHFPFIELYIFLCSPPWLTLPLQPSHMPPMLPICSGDLIFFYFPCRLDLCMSLLGSSLLSKFSGVMNCRLAFLCFMCKSHFWVTTYCICISWSGLPQLIWCFLDASICPKISRCH